MKVQDFGDLERVHQTVICGLAVQKFEVYLSISRVHTGLLCAACVRNEVSPSG